MASSAEGRQPRPVSLASPDALLDAGVGAVAGVEQGEVRVGLIVECGGEAVPVEVVQGLLGAGVQGFAADQQPGAGWEPCQVDQIGGFLRNPANR